MSSVACKVWSVECKVSSVKCRVWSVEWSYVCLCLCLSLYGREVTFGYARLRGSMGATFCHLAALRSAIEFLFWDHWETAVLGQILAGRSRQVAGANFCHLAAPRPPIEFFFWIIGKRAFWAKSWPGAHGRSRRSWEVTEGYGHGGGKRRKLEERQEKGTSRRQPKTMTEMSSVKCKVWSVEWKV